MYVSSLGSPMVDKPFYTLISHEGELSEGQWHQVMTFESGNGIDILDLELGLFNL